jgi:hypothetical protein
LVQTAEKGFKDLKDLKDLKGQDHLVHKAPRVSKVILFLE